jgi:hypothetical protein
LVAMMTMGMTVMVKEKEALAVCFEAKERRHRSWLVKQRAIDVYSERNAHGDHHRQTNQLAPDNAHDKKDTQES